MGCLLGKPIPAATVTTGDNKCCKLIKCCIPKSCISQCCDNDPCVINCCTTIVESKEVQAQSKEQEIKSRVEWNLAVANYPNI